MWWSKDGKNISSIPGKFKESPTETLVFTNLTLNDFGYYTCFSKLSSGNVLNISHGLFFDGKRVISNKLAQRSKGY